MSQTTTSEAGQRYKQAEQKLFEGLGLEFQTRHIELKHPAIKIRTIAVGEGKPLLVVAGGAGLAVGLASLFPRLKDYQIITLDRPGAGLSDGIDHRMVDLRELAVHTLETVLDAYDLTSVPVISNSMGGLWAFWLGLDRPNRVTLHAQLGCPALILSTSAPVFMRLINLPILGNFVHNMAKPKDISATRSGLKFLGHSPETYESVSNEFAEVSYWMYQLPTYDVAWRSLMATALKLAGANPKYSLKEDELRRVQQPVQFIWGDNDPFGNLEVARRVAEIIPNAQLHTLPGGHLLWLDAPDKVGTLIAKFLASHS